MSDILKSFISVVENLATLIKMQSFRGVMQKICGKICHSSSVVPSGAIISIDDNNAS